eukprot:jgi/Ulvmu1/725/UM010_0097.1
MPTFTVSDTVQRSLHCPGVPFIPLSTWYDGLPALQALYRLHEEQVMESPNVSPILVACALGVPAAAALAYWLSWKSYDFIPIKYQYVPGTITGWLSERLEKYSKRRRSQRPIRVYLDGCFDLMHYGHANALRQARTLGDVLVVGVNPDEEIRMFKGPPVMNDDERCSLVEAVKWVDEIIPKAPYVLTKEFMDVLFTQHKIDYIVHGDDPCLLPDGTDVYDYPKRIGRFRVVKRTEGVSTTDIVGRMLMCGRANRLVRTSIAEQHLDMVASFRASSHDLGAAATSSDKATAAAGTAVSTFLPTSRRIVQFANGIPAPPGARVVYIDGGFDLFHLGHLEILKLARQAGDYLLVGVHADADVTARRGAHLPILSVHERCLSVMACRHVDEVIIGAPLVVTEDLIKSFNIAVVVRGSLSETSGFVEHDATRYQVPRARDMFIELQSPSDMTTKTIIKRIIMNSQAFEERQAKKVKGEQAYYENVKQFVDER